MRVDPVVSRADLQEFLDLPLRLHPRDLAVPLLASTVESWWRGTSPHPGPVRLLLVRDDAGTVVGRSTVHTDARLDERLGARSLLFGATELADADAARALIGELERRAAGYDQLFGPVSLLPNQAGGVITSGFTERGFVDSAWNPEWVPQVLESLGFERWGESDTWVVDATAVGAPTADEWAAAGVRLEYGRRSRVAALVPELRVLLNRSFAQLPYYTQITAEEMAAATDGLSFLLDEKLLLLARDAATGEALAFVLVVPDISRFLQRTGGRLSSLRQLQLLATRHRYRDEAILIIQGTDPAQQGRGLLTLLSRQLHANLAAGGYRRLRSTYVGRDNPASARQFERFGGRPLQGYTFYRRPVGMSVGATDAASGAVCDAVTDGAADLGCYLRTAGRAPSAHNTQPWLPRVVGNAIEVAVAPGRTLPAGDPTGRDLLLGLGAWIESVAVAAAADGRSLVVRPLPALGAGPGALEMAGPLVELSLDPSTGGDVPRPPFTPDDVRQRRVFRGALARGPEIWDDGACGPAALPDWLDVRQLDDATMRRLVTLGYAHTAAHRDVAAELLHWLRLSPAHPGYQRDGMTDAMLGVPGPLARALAPVTRRRALRDPVLAVASAIARRAETLLRRRALPPVPPPTASDPGSSDAGSRRRAAATPHHLVLVADVARLAGADRPDDSTEGADRITGSPAVDLPPAALLDAGRALQRLWLHGHRAGVVVAPHSEVVDSPHARAALRRRLGLGPQEVPLAVFSAGHAQGDVPRSPRLGDP